jgi:hypothetical protein
MLLNSGEATEFVAVFGLPTTWAGCAPLSGGGDCWAD